MSSTAFVKFTYSGFQAPVQPLRRMWWMPWQECRDQEHSRQNEEPQGCPAGSSPPSSAVQYIITPTHFEVKLHFCKKKSKKNLDVTELTMLTHIWVYLPKAKYCSENSWKSEERKIFSCVRNKTYLMHVGENYKAQLFSHIKCINCKIVLQLGNWDESIELKGEYTALIIWVSIDTYLWIGLTFLSTISLPCVASELPYAMAKLDIGSERMDWPGNPDICDPAWFLLSRWQLQTEKTGECTEKDKAYTCNFCLSCKKKFNH